jgi:hypothetical protein
VSGRLSMSYHMINGFVRDPVFTPEKKQKPHTSNFNPLFSLAFCMNCHIFVPCGFACCQSFRGVVVVIVLAISAQFMYPMVLAQQVEMTESDKYNCTIPRHDTM